MANLPAWRTDHTCYHSHDSMNLLQKVESGMGCPDWHTAMHSLRLQTLLWIYCSGHAGVSGNERADRLAKHSRCHILSAAWQGRGAPRLEEPSEHRQARASQHWSPEGKRSWERKWLTFHPFRRERSVFNQTNVGPVSRTGRLLRDGGGMCIGLSTRNDTILCKNWN